MKDHTSNIIAKRMAEIATNKTVIPIVMLEDYNASHHPEIDFEEASEWAKHSKPLPGMFEILLKNLGGKGKAVEMFLRIEK